MFEVGNTILYGNEGACLIQDIIEKDFGGTSGEYYVLEPIYQRSSKVFVPLDNEKLLKKMRKMLSTEELMRAIREVPNAPSLWIDDESERKAAYKEILSRAECAELMQLVKTLYNKREELQENGKKMHVSDCKFLKMAEKMVNDECALILRIDPEQVPSHINEYLTSPRSRKRMR